MGFASTHKAWAYLESSQSAITHLVVAQAGSVKAARQTFDGITYTKGTAILKQLIAHVGQEVFLKAMGLFLERKAYSNVSLDDFPRVLSQVSGRDTQNWTHAWLYIAGPLVITDKLVVHKGRIVSLTLQ